jgi:uncharacterized protein with FMN-binding domain
MAMIRSATLAILAGVGLAAADAGKVREPTAAEIAKLVQAAVAAKPDWWDATALNYPPTLDLSCPKVKGWQPKVAPGAWHFDVVHPNPKRWKEGTKFWHLVLTNAQEKKLPEAERGAKRQLAECYGDLLNDWPRALHWYAEVARFDAGNPEIIVSTAYAYWRLGSRSLAVQALKPLTQDATRHGSLIKLWADLGDYATAARLAEQKAKSCEDIGWFMAGYVAQLEGGWKKALDCYQRAANADQGRSGRDWKQTKQRAASAIAAITLFETLDLGKVADGTYTDSSTGYVGPVAVAVTVAAGKIQSVQVKQHKENRFLTALDDIPARIIAKQHVKGVDAVLGATLTSEAIVYATAKALRQGQRS